MIQVTIDSNTSALMGSLKGFGPQVMRSLGNAFRRELRHTRSDALARFRNTTIGRRMPRRDSGGLVALSRVRREDGGLVATLSAKGLAGLVETGGRTQPHRVRHPGGPVASHPFLRPAAEGLTDRVAAEMREAILAIWVGRLLAGEGA
jgi:hypothetical protein